MSLLAGTKQGHGTEGCAPVLKQEVLCNTSVSIKEVLLISSRLNSVQQLILWVFMYSLKKAELSYPGLYMPESHQSKGRGKNAAKQESLQLFNNTLTLCWLRQNYVLERK